MQGSSGHGEHPLTHRPKEMQGKHEMGRHAGEPKGMQPGKYVGHGSHAHAMQYFKRRFIICFFLTFPILALSPLIQSVFGFSLHIAGSAYILFLLSSLVYFYGGYPFLRGFADEIRGNDIGMMTLIAWP